MRFRQLLAAVAALSYMGLPTGSASANEVVFNVFTGPRHHSNPPFRAWAADVAKVTSGRVTIKFLPTSAAPPPKQIDAVVSGQFDAAYIFNGFTARRAVGPQIGLLPFMLNSNAEIGSLAYWRTYEKFFAQKKEFEKIGIRVLSAFQYPGNYFHSGDDKPIMSVADMKTKKMWALAGTPSAVLKNAGVNHVSGPAARVNEFTQTNVVDGLAGISFDGVRGFGALSFVRSSTILDNKLMAPAFLMFISEKKWQTFSPADQTAILAVSGEKVARAVGKSSDVAEEVGRQALIGAKVKFLKGTPAFEAELRKAGAPLVAGWIAKAKKLGIDGQAAIDFYKAEVKKLNAGK